MSVPSNPTLEGLVIEGLYQAGEYHPSSAMVTRYETEIMEQLKNEISQMCKQPKILQTFSYGTLVKGQSRYSCPSDFSSDLKMVLLDGSVTGTAQGGSQTTLILPPGSSLTLSDVQGKEILITSGNAAASAAQIIDLDDSGSSSILTVSPGFAVSPDATSTYLIVDQQWPVTFEHVAEHLQYKSASLERPKKAFPIGDEDFDEFIFDCPPDKAYGAKYFYFANIATIDKDSQLMSRLYRDWRNYWIQGIKARHLQLNDDVRGDSEFNKWKANMQQIILSGQYGTDLHEMAQQVVDYQ